MDLKFQKSMEGLEIQLKTIEQEMLNLTHQYNMLNGRKIQATETIAMMKETEKLLEAPHPEAHECTAEAV